jgi:hypothetical protein
MFKKDDVEGALTVLCAMQRSIEDQLQEIQGVVDGDARSKIRSAKIDAINLSRKIKDARDWISVSARK